MFCFHDTISYRHIYLRRVSLIIFCEEYNLWSPICSFLNSSVSSCLLRPYILIGCSEIQKIVCWGSAYFECAGHHVRTLWLRRLPYMNSASTYRPPRPQSFKSDITRNCSKFRRLHQINLSIIRNP
jgi:hypothetical protein